MFSRIIHQTYKTTVLPDKWKNTPQSWQSLNPSFEYKFWTDEMIDQFVQTKFPQHYDYFRSLPYNIQRVDMVRYMWLYEYGGIYADLDLACIKPIEPLLLFYETSFPRAEVILVPSQNAVNDGGTGETPELTNAFMISKPKCSFWLHVINTLKKKCIPWYANFSRHLYVIFTTGPRLVLRAYKSYSSRKTTIQIAPQMFLNPCNTCGHNQCTTSCSTESSFVKVLMGDSWHSWDSILFKWIMCTPRSVWILLVVIFILVVFIWKQHQLNSCRQEVQTCQLNRQFLK